MGHTLWAIDLNSESKVGRAFPMVNWFEFRIDGIETTIIGMTHPTLHLINKDLIIRRIKREKHEFKLFELQKTILPKS